MVPRLRRGKRVRTLSNKKGTGATCTKASQPLLCKKKPQADAFITPSTAPVIQGRETKGRYEHDDQRQTFTQIYTPVLHSNGELLVQITNEGGVFCGWADGRGKFDVSGTWEICDKWALEQSAELGRAVKNIRQYAGLEITEDDVSRRFAIPI